MKDEECKHSTVVKMSGILEIVMVVQIQMLGPKYRSINLPVLVGLHHQHLYVLVLEILIGGALEEAVVHLHSIWN